MAQYYGAEFCGGTCCGPSPMIVDEGSGCMVGPRLVLVWARGLGLWRVSVGVSAGALARG